MHIILDSNVFTWVILPLLIFFSRIIDVTLGTIRIIYVSKGKKLLAAGLGFLEVLLWIIVISQVMKNLSNIFCYFAFAVGFSVGNYVGILIEEKLAMGYLMIKIITKREASDLIEKFRKSDYQVTTNQAQGSSGPVNVIYSVIRRRKAHEFIEIVNTYNPKAFYTIEDVRFVNEELLLSNAHAYKVNYFELSRLFKKRK